MNFTHLSRRHFLGFLGLGSLSITNILVSQDPQTQGNAAQTGELVQANEGDTYLILGRNAPVTIKVDKMNDGVNSISFCTEDIIPGDAIPVHKHLKEDEIIFIHRGEGTFTLDDQLISVRSGSTAFVPRGVWHGLKNTGKDTITMAFGYNPSGFEGYFREIGSKPGDKWVPKTKEELDAIDQRFNIIYK